MPAGALRAVLHSVSMTIRSATATLLLEVHQAR
jgi:hypothetical protein